jgi:hypothetical protein
LVLDAVERLERDWPQLANVELAVEEVPPAETQTWSPEPIPLGQVFGATATMPARIVVFRRPLEARASGRNELGSLIYDVMVELVADLLGIDPDAIDPEHED